MGSSELKFNRKRKRTTFPATRGVPWFLAANIAQTASKKMKNWNVFKYTIWLTITYAVFVCTRLVTSTIWFWVGYTTFVLINLLQISGMELWSLSTKKWLPVGESMSINFNRLLSLTNQQKWMLYVQSVLLAGLHFGRIQTWRSQTWVDLVSHVGQLVVAAAGMHLNTSVLPLIVHFLGWIVLLTLEFNVFSWLSVLVAICHLSLSIVCVAVFPKILVNGLFAGFLGCFLSQMSSLTTTLDILYLNFALYPIVCAIEPLTAEKPQNKEKFSYHVFVFITSILFGVSGSIIFEIASVIGHIAALLQPYSFNLETLIPKILEKRRL